MFANMMTLEVYVDTYSEVLTYVDELHKAYSIIGQRYSWRLHLVIPSDLPIELPDDMITYKIEVHVMEETI